jgi:predicted dienelactone hydrolase
MRSTALAAVVALGCGRAARPAPVVPTEAGAPPAAAARTRPPVGVTTRVLVDEVRRRELATTIWYPAAVGAVEHEIEWDGIFVGFGAWNVAPRATPRRLPVVLLSHGSGGDASNLTWLAEALASHGYLAAAMDHPGDRFGDTSVEGRFAAWRRARDVSFVLDALLKDATFGPRIDRARIAAAGHSSGAYTVLALAGLRLQPSAYLQYCSARQPGPDCKLFVDLQPERIADLAEAGKSRRDRRIRAVLALAPVLGPAAIPASLRSIDVPVTIVGSPSDEIVPFDLNAARYQRFIPRARLVAIPDADHFVYMPQCTLPGRLVAAQVCVDRNAAVDRAAVHARVVDVALPFFDRALHVSPPRSVGSRRAVRRR